jgi:flagellar protein FliO/FliZ
MLQNAMPALLLLALMVGLAFALKWARRRLPGIAGHAGPALHVLSSLSLGPSASAWCWVWLQAA